MSFSPRPLLLAIALAGCGGAVPHNHSHTGDAVDVPNQGPSETPIKCALSTADAESQLLFGLPPEDRARLLVELQKGPVAVEVNECRLALVPACVLQGKPRFVARDNEASTDLNAPADIARIMPFSAARAVQQAKGHYPLSLTITITGGFDYGDATVEEDKLSACEKATHVISAYSVGAYELGPKGAQALEKSGDRATCKGASASGPAQSCSELIAAKFLPFAPVLTAFKTKSERAAEEVVKPTEGGDMKSATTDKPKTPVVDLQGAKLRGLELELDQDSATTNLSTGASGEGGGRGGRGRNICDPMDPLCMYTQKPQ